jgi:hypothetical protein
MIAGGRMLLLHVSDFHFGPKSRFADLAPSEFARRFAADLKHQLAELKLAGGIDVVVATGDFAETGTKKEFAQAAEFLRTLAHQLSLPTVRFVLLPGNHDISWAACRSVENEQEELGLSDEERDERIHKRKLEQYERMVADLYSFSIPSTRRLEGGGWLYDFEDLGLSVAALNSCEKETHRKEERYGYLSTAQSQSVLDWWQTEPEGFRILALHHPPVPTIQANVDVWRAKAVGKDIGTDQIERFIADLNGIQGSKELRNLAEQAGAQLVLHGHQHAGDTNHWANGYCHVLSAGSLCLVTGELPADEPPGFKLFELVHRRNKAKVWSFAFAPRNLAPGQVKQGMFRPDTAEPQPRELPIKAPRAGRAGRAETALGAQQELFLQVYRQAFEADFDRWDLSTSGVTTAGRFREAPAALDQMYLPLRLAAGWNPQQPDRGEVLEPAELLKRQGSLLIRGPAGAGKTTWARHTFRRLIRNFGAFPLLLVLRDLALGWRPEVQGKQRSLVAYMEDEIAERLGGLLPNGRLQIQPLLAAGTGPRPVLLVDGWDEIGPLGEDIRTKLRALMRLHPRLLVVVTSRPYDAGGRPSSSDGFTELDVQPLNDREMSSLSDKFFRHLFGADGTRATAELSLFRRALERSVEARELGRTPLLLTMMLGIHSVEPLPDKRHRLYEACVRNLLANLPERKAEEGARVGSDQWCPDSDERLRVVAGVAFQLQQGGYGESGRRAIVLPRAKLLEMLPAEGKWQDRQELFLNWLVGTAGLLGDQADGSLSFSHLSFQEYLSAHHLKAALAGDERLLELAGYPNWWETLLLWAALAGGENAERADNMVDALLKQKEVRPQLLGGLMLADGLGTELQFGKWVVFLLGHLQAGGWGETERVARAFAASRQEERRASLLASLDQAAGTAGWLFWERLAEFAGEVDSKRKVAEPRGLLARVLVGQLAGREQQGPLAAAAARCLAGAHPLWPLAPAEWALLQLWPSPRRTFGARIQVAVASGAGESLTGWLAASWVPAATETPAVRYWARYWARYLARGLARDWAHHLVRDLTRYWARYLVTDLELGRELDLVRDLGRGLGRYLGHHLVRDLGRDLKARHLMRDLAHNWSRDLGRGLSRDSARDWARNLALPTSPECLDFLGFDLGAFGWPAARALLASATSIPDEPRWRLLQEACRYSLEPRSPPGAFERSLAKEESHCGEPLWPALARHLARRTLPGDRGLLEETLLHPETASEPLRSGLQFIARGDVIFDDGSVKTLEEICEGLDVDLPLLEDMPDELDLGLDWDQDLS